MNVFRNLGYARFELTGEALDDPMLQARSMEAYSADGKRNDALLERLEGYIKTYEGYIEEGFGLKKGAFELGKGSVDTLIQEATLNSSVNHLKTMLLHKGVYATGSGEIFGFRQSLRPAPSLEPGSYQTCFHHPASS